MLVKLGAWIDPISSARLAWSTHHALHRRKSRFRLSMAAAAAIQTDSMCALDIPPTVLLGARVEHILVEEPGLLSQTIADVLSLPQDYTRELIRFGAVHWCPVPPERTDAAADPQQVQQADDARKATMQLLGRRPELSQPKRAAEDVHVSKHAYVRVHVQPKRFPAAYTVDWKERIVHVTDNYVMVNKPAGVPVVPSVDNILESCLACAAQAVGEAAPLLSIHRLDACTEGLVVLGRSRPFVAAFNRVSQEPGRVQKHYRTLTLQSPPLGALVHHVNLGVRRKGLPAHTQVLPDQAPGSVRCELEVLEARSVQLGPAARALGWPETAWEGLLVLRTGRTHQIRAQFAAVGAPLLGDTLYGPLAAEGALGLATADEGASEEGRERLLLDLAAGNEAANLEGRARLLREPLSAGIGLQACRLTVVDGEELMGGRTCFEAPAPWWHH